MLLHQLFYNLVNNALKFTMVDVPPQIEISGSIIDVDKAEAFQNDKTAYAQILIKDNGIGFDPKQAEKIFKTFTRLNAKDKYEGTGLGLALCKKIVERPGGSITAIANEGAGATFKVVLPVMEGVN